MKTPSTEVPEPTKPKTREEEIQEDCRNRWRYGDNITCRKDERAYLYRALLEGELIKLMAAETGLAEFDRNYELWPYCAPGLRRLLRAAKSSPGPLRDLSLLEAATEILDTVRWRIEECLGESVALTAHYAYFDSLDDDE